MQILRGNDGHPSRTHKGKDFLGAREIKKSLTGRCPVSPALEGGVKGHNIERKYLTGKPCPLGRGASLLSSESCKLFQLSKSQAWEDCKRLHSHFY